MGGCFLLSRGLERDVRRARWLEETGAERHVGKLKRASQDGQVEVF
jgi:hypothetical protein